eukprot:4639595-Alexandrium_andersonii.AAC.1
MSASLVGSEMCIRDRSPRCAPLEGTPWTRTGTWGGRRSWACLLYTSDAADDMQCAADDMQCVDLGGR